MALPPASSAVKTSMPKPSAIESPTADHSEYRPPTQSQKPNMLTVSMPNAATAFALVETATKCRATAASPRWPTSQSRAVRALRSVSWVVKVFEVTMNRVVSGSRPCSVWAMWVASTLETKCVRRSSRP